MSDNQVTCYECNGSGLLKICKSLERPEYCRITDRWNYNNYHDKCRECVKEIQSNQTRYFKCFVCHGSGKIPWIDNMFRG